jgi:TonB family protein
LGRALTLLVVIGLCATCGPVYTSSENADLIGRVADELDFDAPPVPIQVVRPEYPEMARKMGVEGLVHLRVLILENGKVGGVEIIESANPLLVDAAVTALRQSLFSPAKKAGQPCCGVLVIPFVFGGEESWSGSLHNIGADRTGTLGEEQPLMGKPSSSPEEDVSAAK